MVFFFSVIGQYNINFKCYVFKTNYCVCSNHINLKFCWVFFKLYFYMKKKYYMSTTFLRLQQQNRNPTNLHFYQILSRLFSAIKPNTLFERINFITLMVFSYGSLKKLLDALKLFFLLKYQFMVLLKIKCGNGQAYYNYAVL